MNQAVFTLSLFKIYTKWASNKAPDLVVRTQGWITKLDVIVCSKELESQHMVHYLILVVHNS
jgi:hypothetical protein